MNEVEVYLKSMDLTNSDHEPIQEWQKGYSSLQQLFQMGEPTPSGYVLP